MWSERLDNSVIYAPIVIPTLCRFDHLRRSIESLANNSWAKFTDLFICVDYPANESHVEGHKKICAYLRAFDSSCFASFNVIERETNYGAGNNAAALISSPEFQKYDRFIFGEDDLQYSPNYIEYMDKCLMAFEGDEKVYAICGYAYPCSWQLEEGASAFFSQATYSAWGTGQWLSKRNQAVEDIEHNDYLMKNGDRAIRQGIVNRMISGRRAEYVSYIAMGARRSSMTKMTDMALGPYLMLSGKMVVIPAISKVRNFGFDGTGLYCSSIQNPSGLHSLDYDYSNQPIDASDSFELRIDDTPAHIAENHALLDRFLYVTPKKRRTEKVGLAVYRAFGPIGCKALQAFYDKCRTAYHVLKR